ncbi:WD40-repeat-containing domain protein, partial [Ephemerocybe angulata]
PAPKLIPALTYAPLPTPLRSSFGALDAPPSSYHGSSTSGAQDSEAYILSIASINGAKELAVATSSPSNAIHIVDAETLRFVRSLNGGGPLGLGAFQSTVGKKGKQAAQAGAGGIQAHVGGVTCLKAYGEKGEGLISCGKEGSVVIWDARSGAAGVKMYASGMGGKARPLLSCDISADGWTVAAGSELQGEDAVITYWDPRNPTATLRSHTSTHSDDVTVVSFAPTSYILPALPSSPSGDLEMSSESQGESSDKLILLTGSTDGLLAISDANEEDEDEAVLLTANWGTSVAQAGWVGDQGVWAGSDMETFSTWSAELDPVLDFDIREPGAHTEKAEWVTDYLVTAQSTANSQLRVFVGSNEGDISLISTPQPLQKAAPSPRKRKSKSIADAGVAPWCLHTSWTHQHVGVVRALLCDEKNGVVVSGGEDARLHVWRDPCAGRLEYAGEEAEDVEMGMDVDDEEEE